MSRAMVVLAEGFEEIEALTAVDVLRRGGVDVVTASLDGSDCVAGAHGISVRADSSFARASDGDFDAVVLPGGGKGTENLRHSEAVAARLRRQREEGKLLCAICAAPTVLVEAGVLDPEQHITCYPTCVMDIDRPSANVPVVADGNVITGQGPGASLLFALVVLKALAGEKAAEKVARAMVTDVL